MPYCAFCGTLLSDSSGPCPACGKSANLTANPTHSAFAPVASGSLADNVAGMLAYFTIIPAIVFLLMEPYNKRRFIRFHAFQCLFLAAACVLAGIALRIFMTMPMIGLAALIIWPILWLAEVAAWLLCVVKAFQGEMFKLPVIGDLAEKQTPPDQQTSPAKAA